MHNLSNYTKKSSENYIFILIIQLTIHFSFSVMSVRSLDLTKLRVEHYLKCFALSGAQKRFFKPFNPQLISQTIRTNYIEPKSIFLAQYVNLINHTIYKNITV